MNKICIIGAGPAGLTAAYEILKKDPTAEVVILEESSVIGGISQTHRYKGNRMDLGGHRFFSKDERVMKLWQEFMPLQGGKSKDDILTHTEKPLAANGPDPEKTDEVMLLRNRVSRIFFLRKFFDYPITLKGETFKNMGFKNTMKAGFGYLASCIHKRKENSLEDFYINRFGKPLYQMFFEDYTTKLWGISPSQISPDWGAQRVKGLSLWKAVWSFLSKPFKKNSKKVETSLIEQFWYPKFGPGQLYETMAKRIEKMGGKIVFHAKVDHVVRENGHIAYLEATVEGKKTRFDADAFISSMPIKDLYVAMGKQASDPAIYEVASNLIYRDFITVGLLVDHLKIKNKTKIATVGNIVPDNWIYVQERDVKVGRLQIFNNWSPYMVEDNEHKVFMGLEYFVTEGDELWNMSDKDFIDFAISEMEKIDILDKGVVLDSCRLKVKKAYPAYFGSYKDFDKVKADLQTIDNLYCVGRNGQHHYNNMDHSMVTAMIAASLALNEKQYQPADLWEVNTEKAYHETRENKEEASK